MKNKLPVDKEMLDYFRTSLRFKGNHYVSGEVGFTGSPIITQISGKTGTAEVYGKQDTSWFASWAPAAKPRFVVVSMIEQAGTGGTAAAPAARRVWEGLLGAGSHYKAKPVVAGSRPATTVPHVVTDAALKTPTTATTTPAVTGGAAGTAAAPSSTGSTPAPSTPPGTPTLPTTPDVRASSPTSGRERG